LTDLSVERVGFGYAHFHAGLIPGVDSQAAIEQNFGFLRGKTLLLAGASGLIGSNLVHFIQYLNAAFGYNVSLIGLIRKRAGTERGADYLFGPDPQLTWLEADLTDSELFQRLSQSSFQRLDYIIHAGVSAQPRDFVDSPIEIMQSTYLGTSSLLELAEAQQARFLLLSSSEVYGNPQLLGGAEQLRRFTETDFAPLPIPSPRASYPESKRAAEVLCAAYVNERSVDAVIARPGVVFGASLNAARPGARADLEFINAAANRQNIVLQSTGQRVRSYISAQDCARALCFLLGHGASGGAYNIADPNNELSLLSFASTVAQLAEVDCLLPNDLPPTHPPTYGSLRLDASKLASLGWSPNYRLTDALKIAITQQRIYNAKPQPHP
jgi:nucleoside-diphosphate-sugar epimerase